MFEFGLQLTNFKQYHSNESEFFDLICFTLNLWKKELISDHVADTILLSIIGEIHLFSQVFYRFGVHIHRTIPEKAEIYVRNLKRIKSECKNPQQIKSIDGLLAASESKFTISTKNKFSFSKLQTKSNLYLFNQILLVNFEEMNVLNETQKNNLQNSIESGICIRCSLYFVDFYIYTILIKTEEVLFSKN
jgi:hypothetical protein